MSAADAIDWDRLCTSMAPRLRNIARSVLRDEHEVEDAVQDALLAAWRGADRLRSPASIEAWIARVTRNVAIDRLRSFTRWNRTSLLDGLGVDSRDLQIEDAKSSRPEERLAMREAIAGLSPTLRRAVRYELRGILTAQVAALEGISAGAVKTRRTRARAQIRETLDTDRRSH